MPVLEKDVDGPSSLPLRLDGEVPNHLYPKIKITMEMAQERPDLKAMVGYELHSRSAKTAREWPDRVLLGIDCHSGFALLAIASIYGVGGRYTRPRSLSASVAFPG